MKLTLPWPPAATNPNARGHWTKLASAKKKLRQAWGWQALAQGAKAIKADALHLTLTFYPPRRGAYDLDNALAACKAGLDGLADVLKVDDSHWKLTIQKSPGGETGGYVLVEVAHE